MTLLEVIKQVFKGITKDIIYYSLFIEPITGEGAGKTAAFFNGTYRHLVIGIKTFLGLCFPPP